MLLYVLAGRGGGVQSCCIYLHSGVVFAEGDRKKYEFFENQKLIQKTFDLETNFGGWIYNVPSEPERAAEARRAVVASVY